MAYKVIILYRLYMPSYFLGTFTEYPKQNHREIKKSRKTAGLSILKRVTSGTRTHDIQNHNLTL